MTWNTRHFEVESGVDQLTAEIQGNCFIRSTSLNPNVPLKRLQPILILCNCLIERVIAICVSQCHPWATDLLIVADPSGIMLNLFI